MLFTDGAVLGQQTESLCLVMHFLKMMLIQDNRQKAALSDNFLNRCASEKLMLSDGFYL
jgi:hypothetical protein